MTILTVGAGQQYSTIASAVNASRDGDTVQVSAGTYTNDFVTVSHNITMTAVGGQVTMVAVAQPPNGKAILDVTANLTISGFGFTGATVGDGNGAGIRYESGNLDVENCTFWNNQNGILANASTGSIIVNNSEFSHNGEGDGYTHNIYVGAVASLLIENSYFHDAVAGHEIKSRALATTIVNNRIFDNAGDGSYSIDLPNGGVDVVKNNVIEKGANTVNWITLHFGGEGTPYAGSSLSVTGNTIVNDNPNGYLIANQSGLTTVNLSGNSLFGYAASHLVTGTAVNETGDTTLATRPTLDLSTVLPAVTATESGTGTVTAPTVGAVVPTANVLRSFGVSGAVTATGHILTVGFNAQFGTLAEALIASVDGDTIEVAAGAYYDDLATVNHKVIIEGVNGTAYFIQTITTPPNHGILTVNTDVTIRDVSFSGATNYSGREAGIYVAGGNVTLNNVSLSGNDIGLNTADDDSITVSVYNSKITGNGNEARGTNNLNVGAIESFTLVGSKVSGATTGHEISDHAENTDIENNTIADGSANSSFLIDLGLGGNAVIANNVLDKGANAANGVLIHVGGEGTSYSNSNVVLRGNSLVSEYGNAGHPYTYFIVGDQSAGSVTPITATGNTFYGGLAGSAWLINATGSGNVAGTLGTQPTKAVTVAGASKVTTAVTLTPRVQPNTLVLGLSETRGEVDGQFNVSVDGVVVGGGVVTADHATQAPQLFTFTGSWGAGSHTVAVTALNVSTAIGPQVQTLFTDTITLDGNSVAPETGMYTWADTVVATLQGKLVVPDFDAAYYLAHNPDVAAAGIDPLQHYLTIGWKEGRDPSALFNTRYYLNQNPDVAAAGVNPLLHYEQFGWAEGRDPSALFSTTAYLAHNPSVVQQNIDPLQQYTQVGKAAGAAIYAATPHATVNNDPLVDAAYYYANTPAAALTGMDPGLSYHVGGLTGGWQSAANPDAWFNTSFYLQSNPDVKAAGVDPLLHFETNGWKEGRDPSQYFSLKAYEAANPTAVSSGVDPLLTFITSGQAAANPLAFAYPEAKLFDATYYLAHNPDVAAAHLDPLMHYETTGWKEGRDPSAAFSTNKYLAAYSDVKAAGIDPLYHYANYGVGEHRSEFSV